MHFPARLPLPFQDRLEPELHERERAGIFQARQEHDIAVVPQVVEAMRDVLPVQLTPQTMRRVVERMGRRRRVGQVRGLDAVHGAPGEVAVVGLRLQQVVLIVEVEDEDAPLAVAQVGELLDPGKVPGVECRQVVQG